VTKPLQMFALVLTFALGASAVVRTQDKPATTPPAPSVPVRVTVVISRSQGEKKISSMPYTLSVIGNHASLRLGTKIPVMMVSLAPPPPDGKPIPQVGPVQYQDVGTNIDCDVKTLDEGRFMLSLSVDDSSVYADEAALPGGTKGNPSFRSFRASNSMILKDGQTGQFTSATDKLTGETVKVDVTLTVVK